MIQKQTDIMCPDPACGKLAGLLIIQDSDPPKFNGVPGRIEAHAVRIGALLRQFHVTCRHCGGEFVYDAPKPE